MLDTKPGGTRVRFECAEPILCVRQIDASLRFYEAFNDLALAERPFLGW